jgi:hypothetical protein
MDEDERTHMALFRYGVIAPRVCGGPKPDEKLKIRQEILSREFEWADGVTRMTGNRLYKAGRAR